MVDSILSLPQTWPCPSSSLFLCPFLFPSPLPSYGLATQPKLTSVSAEDVAMDQQTSAVSPFPKRLHKHFNVFRSSRLTQNNPQESENDLRLAYLGFFSASTGSAVEPLTTPSSPFIQAWNKTLTNALSDEIQAQIITCLGPRFYSGQGQRIRIIGFVTEIVEHLRATPSRSIQTMSQKLIDKGVLNASEDSGPHSDMHIACIFACIGWATLLYKADPQEGKPLGIDTQDAPCFSAPDLHRSFAGRSVAEIIKNMGDVLPTPSRPVSTPIPPSTLYVARLNVATLSQLAHIKIVWVDTVSAHLNFDMTNQRLFVFRFPSFCKLHASRNSMIAGILDSYLPEEFTVQKMMDEILVSYSLIFKLDKRAQQLYKKEKAKASNQLTDPFLDSICLDGSSADSSNHLSFGIFNPKKESFEAHAEFPILSQRLLRIQSYVDGIPATGISSLWKDRRDMSRWYTFWAVIWFGGASLLLAVIQTALAAESVQLARDQMKMSSQASSPATSAP